MLSTLEALRTTESGAEVRSRGRLTRGGDEVSRGDVPCVRRIAQKKATSLTVTVSHTRVCYIETI